MTREEDDSESTPQESNRHNKPQSPNRSVWLQALALPRRRAKTLRSREERRSNASDKSLFPRKKEGASPSSRSLREDAFLPTQKTETKDDKNESGKAMECSKVLTKATTLSGIFGRGKGKTSVEEVDKEPEDDLEALLPLPCSGSSSTGKGNCLEGENLDSGSKSDRLRLMKGSQANRTIFFKSDLPPCSPVSGKGKTSAATEALSGSMKNNETKSEGGSWKQCQSNVETSRQENKKQTSAAFDSETREKQDNLTSTKVLNPVTLTNMRLGSMAFESEQSASPLKSSPLPSPKKMLSSLSGSPRHRHKSFERSTSASHENRDGTKRPVRKETESPWGVPDMGETQQEGESRHSSRKSIRRLSVVLRLTRKKSAHSTSSSLNLSDEEIC